MDEEKHMSSVWHTAHLTTLVTLSISGYDVLCVSLNASPKSYLLVTGLPPSVRLRVQDVHHVKS